MTVPVYCSWSGGKDSALALHAAWRDGRAPGRLLTMMTEDGRRSRSHGLSRELLERQAAAVSVPIRFGCATWADYEDTFHALVSTAVRDGMVTGVHGDIDIAGHRAWVESMAAEAGADVLLPLWQRDRDSLVRELVHSGFVAMVVAVRAGTIPPEFLGRVVDTDLLAEFSRAGVDVAGENGEYHTVVLGGPLCTHPIEVTKGDVSLRDGVWFLDLY